MTEELKIDNQEAAAVAKSPAKKAKVIGSASVAKFTKVTGRNKRLSAFYVKGFNKEKALSLSEAISVVKGYEAQKAKFDESVDVVFNLGIDAKKSDQAVKGFVSLPKGTGKKLRVIVFCGGNNVDAAKKAGAVDAGAEELIEKVKGGFLDFDKCLATQDMMPKLAAIAKILGPKGLMPNLKLGTVISNVESGVKETLGGKVEFRNDKSGSVAAGVGRLSFAAADIEQNVRAFYEGIKAARPSAVKANYITSIYVSTTMGVGVKVLVSSLTNNN